ncbi:MAG: ribosome biogenesis GTPase Der [Coriobacteriales bacterium]|jgi:GTP-binding protein|nr:ribosome biogenesis GTPase Der [Coriobacteriales bacterium]
MSTPIVAVVGSPNVGKSTLVNRIAGGGRAIVHATRGVTRDRSYHHADWNGRDFILIDTGGFELQKNDAFQISIRKQVQFALREADLVVLCVDARVGLTADDQEVARVLRKSDKPVLLVVNKIDSPAQADELWQFAALGLAAPAGGFEDSGIFALSAGQGFGVGDFLDALVMALPPLRQVATDEEDQDLVKVAIIGKPNAGKSSIANRLARQERFIVSAVAGTTRDSTDTVVQVPLAMLQTGSVKRRLAQNASSSDQAPDAVAPGKVTFRIIDTAGLRKRSAVDDDLEYFSYIRALKAIERADVCLLMIDASEGLTDQVQKIAAITEDQGKALVVLLNKWDLLEDDLQREQIKEHLGDRLIFVHYASVLTVSAKTGRNLGQIWPTVWAAFENYRKTIQTSKLNHFLTELKATGETLIHKKKRLNINYVTQTGVRPPVFSFFANHPEIIDDNYRRYLENSLRRAFDLQGTPVRLRFKSKN